MTLWVTASSSVYAKGEEGHGSHEAAKTQTELAKAKGHEDHEKAKGLPKHKRKTAPDFPKCPVMGRPIDFSVRALTDEGRVYFCCKSCIKAFSDNPRKYADKMANQRKALANLPRVQVTCPVTGQPVKKDVFVEHNGRKVYFCCKDCPDVYEKNPEKYQGRLLSSYTYQTRCPVMGGKIDPQAFVDLTNGHRVYFCCKGCDEKFLENPAKYMPNLEKQGISFDPDKVKKADPAMGGNFPKNEMHIMNLSHPKASR